MTFMVALNSNNHYNHGFHNTFDYNHFTNSDQLLCTMTASALKLYVNEYLLQYCNYENKRPI